MELYTFGLRRTGNDRYVIIGVNFDEDFTPEFYQDIRADFVTSAIGELLCGSFGATRGSAQVVDIAWGGPKTIEYEGELHHYPDCGIVIHQGIEYSWFLRENRAGEFEPSDFMDSNQSL